MKNRKLFVYLSAAFLLFISSVFVSAQTGKRKTITIPKQQKANTKPTVKSAAKIGIKPTVKPIVITRPKIERKATANPTAVQKVLANPLTEQKSTAKPTTISITADKKPRLENDFVTHRKAEIEKPKASLATLSLPRFNQMLLSAIEDRIGAPYHYGSEGPKSFDCSGLVWSVFQQVGINFERGSARALWSMSEPATEEDKTKFGTLVFFNNLKHVGIVADANGFYHASTSKGVMYSPFNEYWTKRLVGFRKVKLETSIGPAKHEHTRPLPTH
jgi:cell wall-associated NlpC family hydrolase